MSGVPVSGSFCFDPEYSAYGGPGKGEPIDFFNGAQPILNVVNPNDVPNQIRVELAIHTPSTGTILQTVWRVQKWLEIHHQW